MKLQVIATLLAVTFCARISTSVDPPCQVNSHYDDYCRTFSRFRPFHQFPDSVNTLMDSRSYEDLLPVWTATEKDGDGRMWKQQGGTCQRQLKTCEFSRGAQDNWVFSHYIPYLEANKVFFNITFSFSRCSNHPYCTNDFANLYIYSVTSKPAKIDPVTDTASYGEPVRKLLQDQTPFSIDTFEHWSFERPKDATGFYLAFQDLGTCGYIDRIHLYYEVTPGVREDDDLVTCPCIPRPYSMDGTSSNECKCDEHAQPVDNITRSTDTGGTPSETPKCACDPGYQMNGGKCTPCPAGTFKATASNTDRCLPCPLNSASLFEGAEVCPCKCSKVRPRGEPDKPCNSPPSAPGLAVDSVSEFKDSKLKVCWLPSKDDGGSPDTLHYNVYEYDHTAQKYTKVNTRDITQTEGGLSDTLCYEFVPEGGDGVMNVIVTSASETTGEEPSFEDVEEVKGRFIALQVSESNGGSTTGVNPPSNPCSPSPCDSNAQCTRQGSRTAVCRCNAGYVGNGFTCQVPPNPCSPSPCDSNARCTRAGTTGFTCRCNTPYVGNGFSCQIPDPCSPSPCDPNASCTAEGTTRAICRCNNGYIGNGLSCQLPPNPCSPSPCDSNAQCTRTGTTGYTCRCNTPYVGNGLSCDLPDPCSPSPCDQHASCRAQGTTSATCTCNTGYIGNGLSCVFDPCSRNPCDSNAQCTRTGTTTYTCRCNAPYQGDGQSCQLPDPCSPSPCDPNAQCTPQGTTRATCTCNDGYIGNGLSCVFDPCSRNPCDSNAQCTRTGTTTYTCRCNAPYQGDGQSCQLPVTTPPASVKPYFQIGNTRYEDGDTVSFNDFAEGTNALMCMTQNEQCCQSQKAGEFYYPDGSIVNVRAARESLYRNRGDSFIRLNHVESISPSPPAGTYKCEIPDINGQTTNIFINIVHESTTEEPADPCSPSPCDANARCIPQGSSAHCRCNSPYEGNGFTCEIPDPCSPNPCHTNAMCTRQGLQSTAYTCTCIPPYSGNGRSCEIPDPCTSSPCDQNARCNRLSSTSTQYRCTCNAPFTGNGFSCVVPDPCSPNPCHTNAMCTRQGGSLSTAYTCTCIPPYSGNGRSCEVPDPCTPSPCDQNARCIRLSSTSTQYRCTCNAPFTGNGFSCVAPTPSQPSKPFFQVGDTKYEDGDTISFDDFGEGDNALLCKTPYEQCCQSSKAGEFYYPSGSIVNIRAMRESLYRNRGPSLIRLNYVTSITPRPPAGTYKCEIPDANGQTTNIYIHIVHGSVSTPSAKPVATTPTTEAPVRPYFQMGQVKYQDGAQLSLQSIGEGDSALKCVTQYTACCRDEKAGEFYDPQGTLVPVNAFGAAWYRNRADGYIRLNRRGIGQSEQAGRYCCEIPDVSGTATRICITLTA